MKIFYAYWKKSDDYFFLSVLDENMRWRKIYPKVQPHFYIMEKDLEKAKRILKNEKRLGDPPFEHGDFLGLPQINPETLEYISFPNKEKLVRINVQRPDFVRNKEGNGVAQILERHGIFTWQSDIPFIYVWMVEEDVWIADVSKSRIGYFDIEVDARSGFPKIQNPTQRILSIALVDNKGKEYFLCDDDEVEVLSRFLSLASRYSVLYGWNIEGFDVPYLNARINYLRKKGYDIRGVLRTNFIDMMSMIKKMQIRVPSHALNDVAWVFLKKKKTIEHLSSDTLWILFKNDRKKLKEYNLTDAVLVKELDDVLMISHIVSYISQRIGVLPQDILLPTRMTEVYHMRVYRKMKPRFILPKRVPSDIKTKLARAGKGIKGAFLVEPPVALYKNCALFDFSSLYPTVIISMGIGIETLCGWERIEDPHRGVVEVGKFSGKSVLGELLRDIYEERKRIKKLMKETHDEKLRKMYDVQQTALKIIMNSMYGVFGAISRLFNHYVANATTYYGREAIRIAYEIASEMGFTVSYGHTDSICICSEYDVDWGEMEEKLNREIRKRFVEKFGLKEEEIYLSVKLEDVFTKFLTVGKMMRYIGLTPEKQLIIKGLQLKRRDNCQLFRIVQQTVINKVMFSDSLEKARREVRKYLLKIKKMLFEGKLDDYLDRELMMLQQKLIV